MSVEVQAVHQVTDELVDAASGLRARIEDVVVDQDARGQGVGTALTMAANRLSALTAPGSGA
jgi:ribosomal protein S18 acetylase RimI-like enzyme